MHLQRYLPPRNQTHSPALFHIGPLWPAMKGAAMSIGTILLIILVLALIGVLPTWGHSRAWGYGPSGGLGLVVVVLLILLLMGKI